MDFDVRNRILELGNGGNWDGAKHLFGEQLTGETMFWYMEGMRPQVFRGTWGRLLGMFGTYPVYYAANIARGFRNATVGGKLAYAGRFLGNTAAIGAGFAALGIDTGRSFWPSWGPVMFSGGPYYWLVNKAILSVGDNYQSRQARAELFGFKVSNGKGFWDPKAMANSDLARWILPNPYVIKNLSRGWDYLNRGEFIKAGLSMGGFSLVNP
jgi:hypothetical protein